MHLLRDLSIVVLFAVAACKGSDNKRSEQGRDGTGQTGNVREGEGSAALPPTAAQPQDGPGAGGAMGAGDAGVMDAAGAIGTMTGDGGAAGQGGATGGGAAGMEGGTAGGDPATR